jgi:hypothetical protein
MMKFARPRRRQGRMPEDHRQRCIDYYVTTHSIQDLAGMLVDLEWHEGCEPPVEKDE